MKQINANIEKYRPRARKIGEPRNQREELIAKFEKRINGDREDAGFKPYSQGWFLKLFAGRTDSELHRLFEECSAPGVERFEGLLKYKLKSI